MRSNRLLRRTLQARIGLLALVVLVPSTPTGAQLGPLLPVPPPPPATCAAPDHPGGDWPSLNGDLRNTRHQAQETMIGVEEVRRLEVAWKFSVASVGAAGAFQSTPIVANGCVYVSASTSSSAPSGVVFALNADTGGLVWRTDINGSAVGLAAAHGRIYALPGGATVSGAPSGVPEPPGTHAVALDAHTGEMLWTSVQLDDFAEPSNGGLINSSPVVFETRDGTPLLFVPLSLGAGPGARVPLFLIDAGSGAVHTEFFVLGDADYEAGYGGVGAWATAAYDAGTGHLYLPTADSEGHARQHRFNNAILKIDVEPERETFASVVDAYSGVTEHYDVDRILPVFEENPLCESGIALPGADPSAAPECLEIDLDFGASATLFDDGEGNPLVGALQKAGVMHAVHTDTMQRAWTIVLSAPSAVGNSASAAFDGTDLYATANPSGLFSLDAITGFPHWASTTLTNVIPYQPITTANGVLYTLTSPGILIVVDAATGVPIQHRLVLYDVLQSCLGQGAGVAVARNTIYVPCDGGGVSGTLASPGWIVAYRAAP